MPLQQRASDYHCHILPGLDDGPTEQAVSVAMARLLFQAGYREVYCTPHMIKGVYDASAAEVRRVRDHLQAEIEQEGIGVRLLLGREYFLDEFLPELLCEPQPLEGTNNVMIEIPSHAAPDLVKQTLFTLSRKGYIPMIAHPERCKLLETPHRSVVNNLPWMVWAKRNRKVKQEDYAGNELLHYLRQIGCMFQANLGSLNGQYGSKVRTNAQYLETSGFYTHAGTDAHSPDALREILLSH